MRTSLLRDVLAFNNTEASAQKRPNFLHWLNVPLKTMEIPMIMPYQERLAPWIVVRLLPKMQRVVCGRFRSRSDADGHLAILQRQLPETEFVVIFDPVVDKG